MKTLICMSPGHFEYHSAGLPALTPDHTILKVKRVGVCGTDLHAFEGTQPFFEYPRILGHEVAGEIILMDNAPGFEIGEAVTFIPYFSCGHCIACRKGKPNCCTTIKVCGVHQEGGMVEYLSVPSISLVHGQGLSYDELALVEPLSIGAHGVKKANILPGEFVLVVGVGPIGLASLEFAKQAGARVIAMDLNDNRLQLCKEKFNIENTINPGDEDYLEKLRDITGGDMPTVVIDASGNLNAINQGFNYIAHGGRYILIGLQKGKICFSHPEFHKKEATLMSSRNATREDFEQVVNQIKNKEINPLDFISLHVHFNDVETEFCKWLSPDSKIIKAIIEVS